MSGTVEIAELKDPIFEALEKLGIEATEETFCRLYRINGTGGRAFREYLKTYDYAPEIEEIAQDAGGGYYQLQITAGEKKAAVNIRIAAPAPVQAAAPVSSIQQLQDFARILKELQIMTPAAAPAVDVTPLLVQQAQQTSRFLLEMQKEQFKEISEMRVKMLEQIEEEEEEEEETQDFDIDSLMPMILEYIPQLLGPSGAVLAPMIKAIPIFQKVKNSIPIAEKILTGAGLNDLERIKLIKILGLPSELLPA